MTKYPDASGHLDKGDKFQLVGKCYLADGTPLDKDDARRQATVKLLLDARFVPHLCSDPTCPGNRNRRVIEAAEAVVEEYKQLCDVWGIDPFDGAGPTSKLSAIFAERDNERTNDGKH